MDSADPSTRPLIDPQPAQDVAVASAARAAALQQRIQELAHRARQQRSCATASPPDTNTRDVSWPATRPPMSARAAGQRSAPAPPLPALTHIAAGAPRHRQTSGWGDCRKTAPTWLFSAVLHALIVTALALLTCPSIRSQGRVITAHRSAPPEVVTDTEVSLELAPYHASTYADPLAETPRLPALHPFTMPSPAALPAPEFLLDLAPATALEQQLEATSRVNLRNTKRSQPGRGAQFYGIQAAGDRFVFIVDSSTSMAMKFANAKRELENAVRGLNHDQAFYVIFFDQTTKRLRLGNWNSRGTVYSLNSRCEPDLVPATEGNVQSLLYWMNTIQLGPETNPHPAVAYALRQLRPDAIFLLSDGEFTDGGTTEALLRRENIVDDPADGLVPKTVVHCVGFYSRVGEVTLKRIADRNGGTYRFIASPRARIHF